MDTAAQLLHAADQFVTDAAAMSPDQRRRLVEKLTQFTRPGGERLMLPGRVKVPAEVVRDVIARIREMA